MIDPNAITNAAQAATVAATQAAQAATQIKATMSPWMPALGAFGLLAGREWNRFCISAKGGAEWLMSHGGIFKLIGKLFWN